MTGGEDYSFSLKLALDIEELSLKQTVWSHQFTLAAQPLTAPLNGWPWVEAEAELGFRGCLCWPENSERYRVC